MNLSRTKPLTPRNGHTLMVAIVARISGCASQKDVSLEDQVDHGKQIVTDNYDGPVEYEIVATKGKGERLDRPELAKIEAMIRSRKYDLLIMDDLGRLVRGAEAVRLCGLAVDNGTRVIAPNDGIDTADDSWEEDVISACRDHVGHNTHTSKRLKQKLMNRFMKFGGATARPIYGFIVPAKGVPYGQWRRDEAATPIYREWFARLRQDQNCSVIAEWLNSRSVPTGPYSRRKTWDGKMVRRVMKNPILKGLPARGRSRTVKHNETGRRVPVLNPDGPSYYEAPHLAHVDPTEFDEVNALVEAAHRGCGRKKVNGVDPLWRVPRERTRFPGQHARCWYCGRQCVWGGNGVTANLMCNGARNSHCWNSMGFSGALTAEAVVAAIMAQLSGLDSIDAQFRELVRLSLRAGPADLSQRSDRLARADGDAARCRDNLLAAIAEYGPRPMFQEKLRELDRSDGVRAAERCELERLRGRALELPSGAADLRQLMVERLATVAAGSPESGDLLRQLVPEVHVYLVRLCDGRGHPLPRARVTLDLAAAFPDARHVEGLEALLSRKLTLDLFRPLQRVRIRAEAAALAAQGLYPRAISARLTEKVTATAVANALALDRTMRQLGLTTPYVTVLEPPDNYSKLRRHRNGKYAFTPAPDYQPPPLD